MGVVALPGTVGAVRALELEGFVADQDFMAVPEGLAAVGTAGRRMRKRVGSHVVLVADSRLALSALMRSITRGSSGAVSETILSPRAFF